MEKVCIKILRNMSKEKMYTSVRMVFLSNLLVSKGLLVLLDALAFLRQRDCLFVCDVVGAETAEINKERLHNEICKRGLSNVVSYKGCLYGDDKSQELKNADLFVFPTYYPNECFPLVLLEAMAHGLPCVSTNEGAISEIVDDGKTGLIVEKNNPKDLANKIELLLNDENLRKKMGASGRKKYEQDYTLEIFEKRLSNILHTLTES